jgi:ATP-dependent helicase/nuclease subunit B
MNDIKRRMDAGECGLLLVVPEQYSHDAERQLSAVCGDRLSLHGETLSFTSLCDRVFLDAGIALPRLLDDGGRMLAMYRALESVAPRLNVFGKKGMRADLLVRLLDTIRELKILNVSPMSLEKMAKTATKPLAEKLQDLALIFGAYDGFLHMHGADASDRLALLASMIGESSIGDTCRIYFDGFNDFTVQELHVITGLLRKNADLTVCLTYDPHNDGDDDWETFKIPRETAEKLKRITNEYNIESKIVKIAAKQPPGDKAAELVFLERRLFGDENVKYPGQCGAIKIYSAPSRYTECEYAAHKVWELVRSGYRWRDIGVMARDWESYGSICENVFEKYGVPYFAGGREDIMGKPPAALIDAALEIASAGWEYKPVFRYLKTGLADIRTDECSELENYVLRWNIRGSMWARDWVLPPSNHRGESDEAALMRINGMRKHISEPLFRLRDGIIGVTKTSAKLRALYAFMENIKLPESISEKAFVLEKRGEARLANEYVQLWDVIVNAMEQCFEIMGDTLVNAHEFRKLFILTLSRYDVGVIPVSLDRTSLGGMAMNRRRYLKCLVVLGATENNMPMLAGNGSALSDNERLELKKLGADMSAGLEERLCREMNMLYSTLTLPSKLLIISYLSGEGERPSSIVKRIKAMFNIEDTTLLEEEYMTAAKTPCFELAALSGYTNTSMLAAAAREHFAHAQGDAYRTLKLADDALRCGRGRLSRTAAQSIYGHELSLSATSVDRYYSCPFAHFLKNGLRLAPRVYARFDAPEAGLFLHYVLENVSREIKAAHGFKNTDNELCRELTVRYIGKYAREELYDFEGRNTRFIYLFRRLEEDVQNVVLDMLNEMRCSDFEPLDFELDLSKLAETAGDLEWINLKGMIDRVDGWTSGGKSYLRVIDYKTGKKSFDLSDILCGRGMQMLIYLFALLKYGGSLFGSEMAPAGVLYVPARDVILKAPRNTAEHELDKMRERELRRGGLVLNDPDVIEAMENGESKKYLPIKYTKDGVAAGDSLVSATQVALLSEHVANMLRGASLEILDGSIDCSPYYKNDADNACMYCEYHPVCGFDESLGDKRKFVRKLKTDEVWSAMAARE